MLRVCSLLLFLTVIPALCQDPSTPAAPVSSAGGVQSSAGGVAQETPLHLGGSVRPPILVRTVDPEFSKAARDAKFSGDVEVYLWVDEDGNPQHVKVVRGVGMGLDEKAVEAIRQYKFKPATLNGKPVTVDLYIEVRFQIVEK